MEKQKSKIIRVLQGIMGVMLAAVLIFFVLGEMFLPGTNFDEEGQCQVFQSEWVRIMPDGSRTSVTVPGESEIERGELLTIETVLPKNQEDASFCIRSMQQEVKIYVDNKIRKEYSTLDTQPFGKTSTIAYVFFDIESEDAGKQLRIELKSDSAYSGYVSEILVGDKSDIWRHFLTLYVPSTIIAVFLFMVSIVVIVGCWIMRFAYKRDAELLYLGIALLMASAWLFAESRLRQFILPNSTVAMYLGFYMIMLMPYPFLSYINKVQRHRHQEAYFIVAVCTILNCIVSTILQLAGIKDFFETMGISHIIIVSLIVFITLSIIMDIRNGYIKEYIEVAIGFAVLMFGGIGEIYMVYVNTSQYNGIPVCVGMVFLLFMACLKALKDVLAVEQEKQIAIAASESKAKFLANMSHEIRTPINTVIGMNEMILRENKDTAIQEYAVNIKNASQMLLGLINDILDISKIEAGKLEITESDYALSSMLNDIITGAEIRAKNKELAMNLEIDETMPAVLKGDEIRIKQILNNLLSNAIKYTESGSITFSAKGISDEKGFSLLLSVADTGIGIQKEDLEKLFDSFQRLELKKNRYIEGTGLGLSITKQLVTLMNGEIDVTSEYGKGSCFTVLIPQKVVENVPMGNLGEKYKGRILESASEKGMLFAPEARVLVVDDNKMNLKVVKALLKRSQIQLDFATGGRQCLQMTKKKKYDLILMDHMMPEPDGVQTLHLLREDKDNANQNVKVIVLTANAIEGVAEEYIKEGFVDYLSKPIESDRLEEMLAKYLDIN